ncbi:MAG: relaxase/mobilization nuclease domain-containing protein, partial [Rhodobacteraceae bacterium]|nr:relaxase/mobilization nuclease domain-containing protein [Paracoccaceae bacterium]
MLIKFFGGAGSGGGIANYLVDPDRAGREDAAPEVVRGDIEQTRELIDSTDRKWTYSTGVISFAPEDRPTEAQQDALMDDFERLAFAGLKRDQYDITWVRHSHTSGGRVELHFLTPRTELSSGKAFNIAPPGWERSYAPLRDAYNYENGWARPDDPARSRTLQWTPERTERGDAREAITAYLESAIVTGQIIDRDGIVSALTEAGYETPRLGKNYITALNPETGERWRLKGRIYEKDWTRDEELDRTTARDGQAAEGGDRGGDPRRAAIARERLEAVIQRRARWVEARYPVPALGNPERGDDAPDVDERGASGDTQKPEAADPEQRGDSSDDNRDLLVRPEPVDDVAAGQRDSAERRERDVSDPASNGADGLDLRRQSLRETEGVSDEQSNPDRKGAVERIRELGRNI